MFLQEWGQNKYTPGEDLKRLREFVVYKPAVKAMPKEIL